MMGSCSYIDLQLNRRGWAYDRIGLGTSIYGYIYSYIYLLWANLRKKM